MSYHWSRERGSSKAEAKFTLLVFLGAAVQLLSGVWEATTWVNWLRGVAAQSHTWVSSQITGWVGGLARVCHGTLG